VKARRRPEFTETEIEANNWVNAAVTDAKFLRLRANLSLFNSKSDHKREEAFK